MKLFSLFLAFSLLVLPSCSAIGVAAGAGATVGVAAAQEGGISRAIDDARIQIEINDLWFKYDVEAFRKLDLTINQGRVLVTGVVQNPEHRVEAVRLAWQPKGVEQVINEVRIAESKGLVGFAKDTWITTRLRAALTFDREVLSINYSIDTVHGTVYLMGFAQNRAELNRVIEMARTISGVGGVVSYVKFVGQPTKETAPSQDYMSGAEADPYGRDASYQSDVATQAPGGAYPPAVAQEPIVITPQGEAVQSGAAASASPDGPYIIREQSVVQDNLQARAVQEQRVGGASSSPSPYKKGIERETVTWNP